MSYTQTFLQRYLRDHQPTSERRFWANFDSLISALVAGFANDDRLVVLHSLAGTGKRTLIQELFEQIVENCRRQPNVELLPIWLSIVSGPPNLLGAIQRTIGIDEPEIQKWLTAGPRVVVFAELPRDQGLATRWFKRCITAVKKYRSLACVLTLDSNFPFDCVIPHPQPGSAWTQFPLPKIPHPLAPVLGETCTPESFQSSVLDWVYADHYAHHPETAKELATAIHHRILENPTAWFPLMQGPTGKRSFVLDQLTHWAAALDMLRLANAAKMLDSLLQPVLEVSRFFGGLATETTVEYVLLEALSRPGLDMHRIDRIQKMLEGAVQRETECPFAVHLVRANRRSPWQFLRDHHVLRGEVCGLLQSASSPFAKRIEEALAGCIWLQHLAPELLVAPPTTTMPARVTALETIPPSQRLPTRIVSADIEGNVQVWDPTTGLHTRYRLHRSRVHELLVFAPGPDESKPVIASVGDDGRAVCWFLADKRQSMLPEAFAGPATALAVVAGATLAVGGAGGTVFLWDVAGQSPPIRLQTGGHEAISHLAIRSEGDSRILYAADGMGAVTRWTLTPGARGWSTTLPLTRRPERPSRITALRVINDSVYWGDASGVVYRESRDGLRHFEQHVRSVIDLFEWQSQIYSAGEDGRIVTVVDRRSATHPVLAGLRAIAVSDEFGGYVTTVDCGLFRFGNVPDQLLSIRQETEPLHRVVILDEKRVACALGDQVQIYPTTVQSPALESNRRHRTPVSAVGIVGGTVYSVAAGSLRCGDEMVIDPHHRDAVGLVLEGGNLVTSGIGGRVHRRPAHSPQDVGDSWPATDVVGLWSSDRWVAWASGGHVYWTRREDPQPNSIWLGGHLIALDVRIGSREEGLLFVAAGRDGALYWASSRGKTAIRDTGHLHPCNHAHLGWLDDRHIYLATDEHWVQVLRREADRFSPRWNWNAENQQPIAALGHAEIDGWTTLAWGSAVGWRFAVRFPTTDLTGSTSQPVVWSHQGQGDVVATGHPIVAIRIMQNGDVVTVSRHGAVHLLRIDNKELRILSGCPLGSVPTSLAVEGDRIVVGLRNGHCVEVAIHGLPR